MIFIIKIEIKFFYICTLITLLTLHFLKTKLFSILLLLLYLGAMLRPVVPLTIYYANYDYIKVELCKNRDKPILECNGSCYVEAMMKEANLLSNDNLNNDALPTSTFYYPIFVLETNNYNISIIGFKKELNSLNYKRHFIDKRYISEIYHPPKIV